MSNFNKFLTFTSESAYDSAYDLLMRKQYSTPKIYTANGNLKKRWYVYFSYRHPETEKLTRVTPFYGDAHKYKTKEDRLFVLTTYCKKILELLKQGYSPYDDNTFVHKSRKQKRYQEQKTEINLSKKVSNNELQQDLVTPTKSVTTESNQNVANMSVNEVFEFALIIKKNTVGEKTYSDYKSKVNQFLEWSRKTDPIIKTVDQLSKKVMQQFLYHVLQDSSARNRNNYRSSLGSLLQVLEDNELVATNFMKSIPSLKSTPKRNKTYTKQTQEAIYKYLETKDPILLLFIKFISYNFLRPVEVCRIQIKDINLAQKIITFKAKNKPLKTKIIPDILIEELPDLNNLNPEYYLFTPEKIGANWETTETNRRGYFTSRFNKVVKAHFKLGKEYGLYSFRHTFITKLYREIRKKASPFEAKSKLMLITGHSSMDSLEKYLRDIDAELPEDYSELIRKK